MDNSTKEDDVEKDVAFLAKNFRKFLKMKNSGKPFSKGKFSSSKDDRKEFRKKDGKDSQSPQGITCFSDLESSNLDSEGSCDEERELLSIYDYCSC